MSVLPSSESNEIAMTSQTRALLRLIARQKDCNEVAALDLVVAEFVERLNA